MTTRQTIKRFFEPALAMKGATARMIFWNCFVSMGGPINVFFLGIIAGLLEKGDKYPLIQGIAVYGIVLCVYHIVIDLIKRRGRPETYYQQMRYIQNQYLPQYLQIDGNHLDKLGTGKLIAILSGGFDKWTALIVDGTRAISSFLIVFLTGLYFAILMGKRFVLGYCILFVCISALAVIIDRPSKNFRNQRRDALNDYSRTLVKFIMARTDIIQNNKIVHEINNTGRHLDQAAYYTLQQAVPLSRMYNIPKSLISIFRIIVVIYGSWLYLQGAIGLGDFSAMLGFIMLIDTTVIDFVRSYKDFTKDLNVLEKLRDIFDHGLSIESVE